MVHVARKRLGQVSSGVAVQGLNARRDKALAEAGFSTRGYSVTTTRGAEAETLVKWMLLALVLYKSGIPGAGRPVSFSRLIFAEVCWERKCF